MRHHRRRSDLNLGMAPTGTTKPLGKNGPDPQNSDDPCHIADSKKNENQIEPRGLLKNTTLICPSWSLLAALSGITLLVRKN